MPLIDYVDVERVDAATREILEGMRNADGEIPAFTRLVARHPHVLRTIVPQFAGLMYEGDVDLPTKQLAFVTVSVERRSPYCTATHSHALVEGLDAPRDWVDAVVSGRLDALPDRERAVVAFAHAAAREPKEVRNEHVDALIEAGFDRREIIELLTVVAQACFANTIVDAMHVLPEDESERLADWYPDWEIPWTQRSAVTAQ